MPATLPHVVLLLFLVAIASLRALHAGEDNANAPANADANADAAAPAAAGNPVLITREQAAALAAARLPGWRARIAANTTNLPPASPSLVPDPAAAATPATGHPRIHFTRETWQNLRARRAAARDHEKELFDAVLERARATAQKPVTAYRPPEAWVTPKNALKSAQAELWQRPIGDDLVNSSLALALEDDPAIRQNIRDTVLTACAWPNWGLRTRGMHLAAAHLSRGIAIACDWHPGIWTDAEKTTIRDAIRYHVNDIADGLHGKAFWALSYHNNHNHVSAAALGLCGLAFLDEIPEAARWLAAATINFDRVIPANNADGSTPEGFSYWAYSLNFITQYIEGTRHITGADALYQAPFLRNAITYRLHGSTPGFDGPLPWGAVGGPANAASILHALAREYRSTEGRFLALRFPLRNATGIINTIPWQALWHDPTLPATPPRALDHHATTSDIVTTRTGWTKNDYLLSIKSGINNRNHGHLDAGALALAFGGEWLLTAPRYGQGKRDDTGGYWSRGGAAGGGRRWTYLSTTTEAHSTLLINGKNQRSDHAARGTIDTFATTPAWTWTSVDLTQAYQDNPGDIRRGVLHRRGDYALVLDTVSAPHPLTIEWLAQTHPAGTAAADPATPDRIHITGKTGSLEIRTLLPPRLAFTPRAPAAPHIDLPENRLKTYALKTTGRNIRYLTLLLPAFAGKQNPVRDIAIHETRDALRIIVKADGWTDTILQPGATPARIQATRTNETAFNAPP